MTGCWYVKDYADGWIKFYDPSSAMSYAAETGAIMKWVHDGKEPVLTDTDKAIALLHEAYYDLDHMNRWSGPYEDTTDLIGRIKLMLNI